MDDKHGPPVRRSFVVAISIVVVGAVAVYAGYSGWRHYQSAASDSVEQAVLIRDIDRVSLLGNVLVLLDDGEEEKARRLLEFDLQSTLEHVDLAAAGELAADSFAVPNLKSGVGQAHDYAQRRGMSVAGRAEQLIVALDAR